MLIFVIVMILIALVAAVGFIVANSRNESSTVTNAMEMEPEGDEDIVTYSPADVPAILNDVLSAVPMATMEEAMVGCYGILGADARPLPIVSLDELLAVTTTAIAALEAEQHIAKFTVSTQKKSKANPHVDLLAHSTDPKRTRTIRFWRTPQGFVATLPS